MANDTPGICDRCGFRRPLRSLRREWTGFKVCPQCWDPRPPDTKPPRLRPEGMPVRDARPEPPVIERDPGDMGGEDL